MPTSGKARVLVVEDDIASQKALVALLQCMGIEAMGASSSAGAISLLGWQPDSIILDLMLPDENGVEVLRYVREHQLPIRVAVATGTSDEQMIQSAQDLAPDAFYPKPLDFLRLVQWICAS